MVVECAWKESCSGQIVNVGARECLVVARVAVGQDGIFKRGRAKRRSLSRSWGQDVEVIGTIGQEGLEEEPRGKASMERVSMLS